jgi:hypothetical protein
VKRAMYNRNYHHIIATIEVYIGVVNLRLFTQDSANNCLLLRMRDIRGENRVKNMFENTRREYVK